MSYFEIRWTKKRQNPGSSRPSLSAPKIVAMDNEVKLSIFFELSWHELPLEGLMYGSGAKRLVQVLIDANENI